MSIALPRAPNDLQELEILVHVPEGTLVACKPTSVLNVLVLPADAFVLCRTRTLLSEEVRLGAPI